MALSAVPINRSTMVGAWWYWGTFERAAKALGITEGAIQRVIEGKDIGARNQEILARNWRTKLSADDRYAMLHGGEFVRAISPDQAALLRRRGFRGKRFVNAVKQWVRRRDRIPRSVGDFIEEAYLAGAEAVD